MRHLIGLLLIWIGLAVGLIGQLQYDGRWLFGALIAGVGLALVWKERKS